MTRPRLFVELCCGSAAVSLRLLGGEFAKPPISYMGSKRGYAHAILGVMGLRAGEGADAALLCDAGPWAHVWSVLSDPDRCRAVADTLRGWSEEEPRALWERLRAEYRGAWSTWTADRAAAFLQINAANRLINVDRTADGEWKNTGQGGTTFGGDEFATGAGDVAAGVDSVAAWLFERSRSYCQDGNGGGGFVPSVSSNGVPVWGSPSQADTAARVDSVAAWLQCGAWSYEQGNTRTGFCGPGERRQDTTATATATATDKAGRAASMVSSGFHVHPGSAADITPPDDCAGVYVYIDPPYEGTAGYTAEFPRADVLETAKRWSDAGAVVCLSEAEPLPLDGWHYVDITTTRIGQKRTFSRQQSEWLTINREPAWKPMVQVDLFGGAA